MFLNKKDCEFLRLIKKKGNESIYKHARKLFSMVTISKKLNEMKKKELIKIELIGKMNSIKLTEKGEGALQNINQLSDYE